jgi:hypothetical protein
MFVNCLTVTVLSYAGALSVERSGLSFVSHSLNSLSICIYIYIYIYFFLTFCMFDMSYVYTIYKPFVSPGSVQQIVPY